jgi:hypothetical protein
MFSLYGCSWLSLISYGLSIIASYLTRLGLFVVTLSILVACCIRLGPNYVVKVYDVIFLNLNV